LQFFEYFVILNRSIVLLRVQIIPVVTLYSPLGGIIVQTILEPRKFTLDEFGDIIAITAEYYGRES